MPPTSRPLKNATLRQLVTFHTVARVGSISRAAEELHLTQPAVSLQLGILEESAGTPLLTRRGRHMKLTAAGELLAQYAERMLQLWSQAGEAMAAQCGQVAGTLRVGVVTTAEYLVPHLLLEFGREHDQVDIKLTVGNRAEIAAQLAQQDVDLAIMGRPPPELRVEASPFARHPMAFVASPDHPLLQRERLELADLADVRLLLREQGSGTRTTVEQLFKTAGLSMRLGTETSSNEAIKQLCAAGHGIAFISLHACVLELHTGMLAQLPLPGHPIEREWYLISMSDWPLPAAAAAFGAFLREHGQAQLDAKLAADRARLGPARGRAGAAR